LILALGQEQIRKTHSGGTYLDDDVATAIGYVVDVGIDYAGRAGKLLYDTGFH
jgi:hypothetical protein